MKTARSHRAGLSVLVCLLGLLGHASAAETGVRIAAAALPADGTVRMYVDTETLAPLRIVTRGRDVHYLVKLVDWQSGKPVQSIFIRAGHSVEVTVPLGSYRLKYAAGEDWLDEEELFGEGTIYNKALKRFNFEQQGRQITGYVVELILQPDGNLPTAKIPESEW